MMFSAEGDRQILPRQTNRSFVTVESCDGLQVKGEKCSVQGWNPLHPRQGASYQKIEPYRLGKLSPPVRVSMRSRMVSVDF
jgi:hypothetical protein